MDTKTLKEKPDGLNGLSVSPGSRFEQATLIQCAIEALKDNDKHDMEHYLTLALSEAVRNAADSKRLDWLLENATIRDYVTEDMAYCLEEGREAIDAAILSENSAVHVREE